MLVEFYDTYKPIPGEPRPPGELIELANEIDGTTGKVKDVTKKLLDVTSHVGRAGSLNNGEIYAGSKEVVGEICRKPKYNWLIAKYRKAANQAPPQPTYVPFNPKPRDQTAYEVSREFNGTPLFEAVEVGGNCYLQFTHPKVGEWRVEISRSEFNVLVRDVDDDEEDIDL